MLRLGPKTLSKSGRSGSFLTIGKNGVFTISVELAKKLEIVVGDQVELIFDPKSPLKDLYLVKSGCGFSVRKASIKYQHLLFNSISLRKELSKLLDFDLAKTIKIMSGTEIVEIEGERVVPLITANIIQL